MQDILEVKLGTDKNSPDTDNDGLTDYQEFFVTKTNPTVYNSVTEGVVDAAADCDDDGLSNIAEIAIGTEPLIADTDRDGLSDGEEVYVYGTDPLVPDSDEDGLCDGDEIYFKSNPLNSDSDNDGVLDGDEKRSQTFVYQVESDMLSPPTLTLRGGSFSFE